MLSPSTLASITGSRVYDLQQPIQMGMPIHPAHPPFVFTLMRRHGDFIREGGCAGCNELLVISGHTGTHLDGLGHMSVNGKLHGDRLVSEHMGEKGIGGIGMETVPPFICRGVLLDVAGHKGVDCLSAAQAVTADDLQACAEAQGVKVEPGDAVLIRTGWMRHWNDSHTYLGEGKGTPGPDASAARWLAERRVRLAGADTVAFEQIRPDRNGMPVHVVLLVEAGIHIMEMVNMEDLASDRVHTFLFMAVPLKIVGGTGSPIRPLAIPVGQ